MGEGGGVGDGDGVAGTGVRPSRLDDALGVDCRSGVEHLLTRWRQRSLWILVIHDNSNLNPHSHVPDLGGVFVDSGHREASSTDAVWGRWRPINDPRGLSRHLERHAVLKDVLRVLAA